MTITIDRESGPGSWAKEIAIRESQGTLHMQTLNEAMAHCWGKWISDGRLLARGHKDEKLIVAMLDVIEAVTEDKT